MQNVIWIIKLLFESAFDLFSIEFLGIPFGLYVNSIMIIGILLSFLSSRVSFSKWIK